VVFFGFWLSHVPLGLFEPFWSLVADCLEPGGRVFFVDDAARTPDELVEGESSSIIRRVLPSGGLEASPASERRPEIGVGAGAPGPGWERLASWAQARKVEVIAESAGRRPGPFAPDQPGGR
jgi:hypothetical protein